MKQFFVLVLMGLFLSSFSFVSLAEEDCDRIALSSVRSNPKANIGSQTSKPRTSTAISK